MNIMALPLEATTLAEDLASNLNLQTLTTGIQPYVPFIAGVFGAAFVWYIIRKVAKSGSKAKFKI